MPIPEPPVPPVPIPPFVAETTTYPPGPIPPNPPAPPPPVVVITRWYSPSARGFFSSDTNTPVPADAVVISDTYWRQLLNENAAGKDIVFDAATQQPVAIVPPVTSLNVRSRFISLMRRTDWTQTIDTPAQIRQDFRNYRDALRLLMVTLPADLSTVVWPTPPTITNPLFNREL